MNIKALIQWGIALAISFALQHFGIVEDQSIAFVIGYTVFTIIVGIVAVIVSLIGIPTMGGKFLGVALSLVVAIFSIVTMIGASLLVAHYFSMLPGISISFGVAYEIITLGTALVAQGNKEEE